MDVLVICQKAGFRRNISLSTLEQELGTTTATFRDLLRHLTTTSLALQALSHKDELVFHYIHQDGSLVPVSAGDRVRTYDSYQTFYLLSSGRRVLTPISSYPNTPPSSGRRILTPVSSYPHIPRAVPSSSISRRRLIRLGIACGFLSLVGGGFYWWSETYPRLLYTSQTIYFVSSVAWSPDGKYIASGSSGDGGVNTVIVFESFTDNEVVSYTGHTGGVSSVAWSPDGKYIASGSGDTTAQVWEVLTGKKVLTYKGHSTTVNSVAWSPDGKYIASGSAKNNDCCPTSTQVTVQVWEALTGKKVVRFTGNTYVNDGILSIAWSPNGKYIATGNGISGAVRVFESLTGKEIVSFSRHDFDYIINDIHSVAWSPDGRYIAFGSNDGTVRIVESLTGNEVVRFNGADDSSSVAWSPNGKYIVSSCNRIGTGATLKIWLAL